MEQKNENQNNASTTKTQTTAGLVQGASAKRVGRYYSAKYSRAKEAARLRTAGRGRADDASPMKNIWDAGTDA